MKALQSQMIDVSVEMQYYSGFNQHMYEKSKELLGASMVLDNWISALEFPEITS